MYQTTATFTTNFWIRPIEAPKKLTPQHVIYAACLAFDIPQPDLLSASRKRHLVRARNVCMYVMKNRLKISLKKIGHLFSRDHTSVMHGLRSIESDLSVPAYRYEMNESIKSVIELL